METTDVLLQHRSIRKFRDEPINVALLTDIINAGCRASTTGNMQVYSIISTSDRELKQKLAPAHFNQKMVVNAPTILTFCADFNRFNHWCVLNDAQPGYDNFLSFMTGAIDALLVAQNVAVAAESKGLGICYLGTTLYNAETIIAILKLPKGVVPVTTLVIGWPDESPTLADRLPLEAILHEEVYHDYSDEVIRELYSEKENLPENLTFIAENNKQSLAQVFTDVRYKKHDNEFFSEKLLSVLKQQGFM